VVVVAACLARTAAADPADDLRAQGEAFAKQGRFTEAIAAFKQSNAQKPRASNSCLIGLAYTRRELWPQAEIMIDRCKRDANAADPVPDWLPQLEQTLASRLAQIGVAPVAIAVTPADAQLTVSSFAPDEQFGPRTIHLPPGSHVVTATAPGYESAQETISISDAKPREIVIVMKREGSVVVPPNPRATPSASGSHTPLIVMAAGGALIATGIVYHATAFRTAANGLSEATDPNRPMPMLFDEWSHRFDVRREWLIGFYAAGAITVGIGAYLHFTQKQTESLPQVSIAPTTGGGIVSVGW